MPTSFQIGLPLVLKVEGGYVNNPKDPGGATNFGVTQATYDAYRRSLRQPLASVRHISQAEVAAVYERDYWLRSHADKLLHPASVLHFDAAVHHGPRTAIRLLQRAVGVSDDGLWGPKTAEAAAVFAVEPHGAETLAHRLLHARRDHFWGLFQDNPSRVRDFPGWRNRIRILETALGLMPERR